MITTPQAADQSEMLTLIVSNPYATTGATRVTATLPADATVQSLLEKVAEECQLVVGTFALSKSDGTSHRLDFGADSATLFEAGFTQKQRLRIEGIDGGFPTTTGGSSVAEQALGTVALWSGGTPAYGPLARGSASAEPNADGFTGLINQGATV